VGNVKLLLEALLALILHPIAVILMWVNLAQRSDLSTAKKLLWGVVGLIWGVGPILYVLLGDGQLW
jgi:hypothetical protein